VSLRNYLRSSTALGQFTKIDRALPRPFVDPLALVEFLANRNSDPDERDAIYRRVVAAAQVGSQLAIAVVWLGLWAALDGIYRRNCRRYRDAAEELVSDLAASFMAAVHAVQLEHIERLAPTLVMNTERRLIKGVVREAKKADQEEPLPEDNSKDALKAPAAPTPDQQVEQLHQWLTVHVPKDAELLTETILKGETQKAFAEREGVSHDSIRKRHQRALGQLRTLSHFEGFDRVYRVRGNKPPTR
jgi:DNA-directed RNA polymerase specialized sigma24 family protein